MSPTHRRHRAAPWFVLLALCALPAQAHGPWVGPGAENVARVLAQALSGHPPFRATAVCRMESPHPGEYVAWTMSIAWRDGKLRTDVDMDRVEGVPPRPAEQVARDRAMGLTRTSFVRAPGRPRLYVYPDRKAYVEEPVAEEEAAGEEPVVEPEQATGLPARIACRTGDGDLVVELRELSAAPEETLFHPPEGFRRFESIVALVREAGTAYYRKPAANQP